MYFAKYLPVEGEINIGDTIKEIETGDIGTVRIVGLNGKFKWHSPVIKIKLFLCSTDLQVGDKVYYKDPNPFNKDWSGEGIIHSIQNSKLCKVTINDEVRGVELVDNYKVIGEISPNALGYVKEGDEFTEDQIETWWGTTKTSAPFMKMTNEEWNEVARKNGNPIVCIIKGPCGFFH